MSGKNDMETYDEDSALKKHHVKLIAFAVFVLIIALVLYTSFQGDFSFTGGFAGVPDSNDSLKISARLNVPELALDGKFDYLSITGNSDSFIYIGDQKSNLSSFSNNKIILEDFDGKISFDENAISNLDGKSMNAVVNGVVLSSSSDKLTKTYLSSGFDYSSLEISESVVIKDLSYLASGSVSINDGEKNFKINDEEVSLKNFVGNLKIRNNVMTLEGVIGKIEVSGEHNVVVE